MIGRKIVSLTPEQLNMIRESTIDEAAYERMVSLFESQTSLSHNTAHNFIFNLDDEQVKLLTGVLDAIPVSVFIKDTNSRFIMANKRTLAMMNVTSIDDIVGKTDIDFLDDKRSRDYFEQEQEIMQTGNPVLDAELFIPEELGGPRWLLSSKSAIWDSDNKVIGLIGVNLEITAQKLAEKTIEQERNLLQTVIDHIQDKIYVKDRESRFILANAATLKSHQITAAEHYGTSDFDYMGAERAQMMYEEEQHIMATGQPIINQELCTPKEIVHTFDHDLWFLVSKVPVYDSNGEIIGLVGVNNDITSRKLAAAKEKALQWEQERSQILADFITLSSHEFRTPLSVIQTNLYLLKRVDDKAKTDTYLEQITQQTHRMNALVDDLQLMLRLDKQTQIHSRAIYLKSLLQMLLNVMAHQLEKKQITIQLIEHETNISIQGERELLGIALSEILDNAVRYTAEHGNIIINYRNEDNHTVITIEDTGIGMTDHTRQRIFERFFRADEAHSTTGFGLGLSIAKRIIELHGGEIEVDSEVGTGSIIRLRLPRMMQAEPTTSA